MDVQDSGVAFGAHGKVEMYVDSLGLSLSHVINQHWSLHPGDEFIENQCRLVPQEISVIFLQMASSGSVSELKDHRII